MLVTPDLTHICECVSSLCIPSCDSKTAIVFASEGSKRVKTATLSFKLNYGVPVSRMSRWEAGVRKGLAIAFKMNDVRVVRGCCLAAEMQVGGGV